MTNHATKPSTQWRQIESRRLLKNRWMEVYVDRVELPNGQLYDYTLIRRNADGVAALVFDDAGRLLLEQEYRYPVQEVIWQLPGGLVDAG